MRARKLPGVGRSEQRTVKLTGPLLFLSGREEVTAPGCGTPVTRTLKFPRL
jgi:hypothetical protein